MKRTAIMIDGGFFHKRANALWGDQDTAKQRATKLYAHCLNHLKGRNSEYELYRIFYYDCPPASNNVYHPLLKKAVPLSKTPLYRWMTEFHQEMTKKRKVAMRMGFLSESQYLLRSEVVRKLCAGSIFFEDLKENDFYLDVKQKSVDMKLGIDVLSIALKRQVSQIVLIAGDSDFVPAAKAARREGIDFILDPMWASVGQGLQEHIDGLRSTTARREQNHSYRIKKSGD